MTPIGTLNQRRKDIIERRRNEQRSRRINDCKAHSPDKKSNDGKEKSVHKSEIATAMKGSDGITKVV